MVTLADERLDEDLLCQILEGSHPALLQDDGSAEQRRRCSSSRSRSRGVGRSTITAATTAQPLAWQGAELNPADWEEEEMVKQLNVIESGPLEEEQWQRICEMEKLKQLQKKRLQELQEASCSSSGPVVSTGAAARDLLPGPRAHLASTRYSTRASAEAAAAHACRDLFGSSNSVFRAGALMSYYLLRGGGTVGSHGLVSEVLDSLPERLRSVATRQLQQLSARSPVVQLMAPTSNLEAAAEAKVLDQLRSNPGLHFYIGISERPEERFETHQANGFTKFWVYTFVSSAGSASAEKALISRLQKFHQCLNVGPGGERASKGQPHYLYIAWKLASNSAVYRKSQ
jgi:hypothetical protein